MSGRPRPATRGTAALLCGLLISALVGVFSVGIASPAAAKCMPSGSTGANVSQADAVLSGRVTSVSRLSGNRRQGITQSAAVDVQRVYKGEITSETVDIAVPAQFRVCSGGMQKGRRYVFFVQATEGYSIEDGGGTAPATTALVREVEQLLGPGRAPVPTAEIKPEFDETAAADDDPPSFSRVAAPGLALVLISVLGLALVRRLAR